MKLDLPSLESLDSVSNNNGEFSIILDRKTFRRCMELRNSTRDEISGLWNQFVQFASEVEMSRLSGYALGSSDPIGALDDQMADRYGAYWGRFKDQSAGQAKAMENLSLLYTPKSAIGRTAPEPGSAASQCKAVGLVVGMALPSALPVAGFNPEILAASDRLMRGGGRPAQAD